MLKTPTASPVETWGTLPLTPWLLCFGNAEPLALFWGRVRVPHRCPACAHYVRPPRPFPAQFSPSTRCHVAEARPHNKDDKCPIISMVCSDMVARIIRHEQTTDFLSFVMTDDHRAWSSDSMSTWARDNASAWPSFSERPVRVLEWLNGDTNCFADGLNPGHLQSGGFEDVLAQRAAVKHAPICADTDSCVELFCVILWPHGSWAELPLLA